jgi:hypothetical protein
VHGVGRHFGVVEVEDLGEDLVGKARADAAHAFVHTGVVAVLLVALGARVGVLQVFTVVDQHLGIQAAVLGFLQPREHGKLAHHLQRARRAGGLGQRRVAQELLVDLDLFADAQAVGHLDDVDAVEEGFVVLVVAEGLPLAFVAVRQHDAVKGNRAKAFGALEVAFLRGRQQRVQHLDRRLEHLHEFQQPLVGQAQAAAVAVGIRVVLRIGFELADVDLAHEAGDVLVVLVARLGLADAHLLEDAGVALDDLELADVAAKLFQPLDGPGAQDAVEVAARDAVFTFENGAVFGRVKQAQRRFVHRAALDGVEGHVLHQQLQPLGDAALAAAHRAQQIQDLLLFFQALRGVAEVAHHLFDGVFHAVELGKGWVDLDHLVGKQAAHARVVARVHALRLANGAEHALGGRGVGQGVALALGEVVLQRELFFARALVARFEMADHIHAGLRCLPRGGQDGPALAAHWESSDEVPALRARAPSELSCSPWLHAFVMRCAQPLKTILRPARFAAARLRKALFETFISNSGSIQAVARAVPSSGGVTRDSLTTQRVPITLRRRDLHQHGASVMCIGSAMR